MKGKKRSIAKTQRKKQAAEDGNSVEDQEEQSGQVDGGRSSRSRTNNEKSKVQNKSRLADEEQDFEEELKQNGCLDSRFSKSDELARKNFSAMTNVDLATLLSRWYENVERECEEIRKQNYSGSWFCGNVCAATFMDFIVKEIAIPCETNFETAQKIVGFILSKICGAGDPRGEDEEAIYADLTLSEAYVSAFEDFVFDSRTFARAVDAKKPVSNAVQRKESDKERDRREQIESFERRMAKKSCIRSEQIREGSGGENSVEPSVPASAQMNKSSLLDVFGAEFTNDKFFIEVPDEVDRKKHKAAAVVWPILTRVEFAAFTAFYKKYKRSVEEGHDSGQFRSMKMCIDIDLRDTVRRKLRITYERYKGMSDDEIILRFFKHFGPKEYKTAVQFLEAIKFDNHDDAKDSQATFMKKFDKHIDEFVYRINVCTACMQEVDGEVVDSSFSNLTRIKIVQIYQDSFKVLKDKSSQAKEVHDHIRDFKASKTFTEMNDCLSDNFEKMDRDVRDKRCAYTTTPSASKDTNSEGAKKAFGGAGGKVHQKGAGKDAGDGAKKEKRVVKGEDRGKCCGSFTNHHGEGCNAKTCVIWDSKFAPPGNKKVWQDSDKEDVIRPPKEEWEKLKESKPKVIEYNEECRKKTTREMGQGKSGSWCWKETRIWRS